MDAYQRPSFKNVSGVYALTDPRTSRVMYVGQSIDIEYRYRQHIDPNAWCKLINDREATLF